MDTDPLYDLLYEKCRKDPDLLATVLHEYLENMSPERRIECEDFMVNNFGDDQVVTVIPTTFKSWFTGDLPDGSSTVLDCFPYTGRYPEIFSHVLRLACPQTSRGWVEQAVSLR
jgi:hypothetical protein